MTTCMAQEDEGCGSGCTRCVARRDKWEGRRQAPNLLVLFLREVLAFVERRLFLAFESWALYLGLDFLFFLEFVPLNALVFV